MLALISILISFAHADVRCYSLSRPDPEGARNENWCYERASDGRLRIFNADGEPRPELTISIDPQGMVTHASLVQGEISFHRVRRSEFNPFALPLSEPVMLTPSKMRPSIARLNRARALFERMENEARVKTHIFSSDPVAGDLHAQVDVVPWRGTAWSYKHKQLYEGYDTPTAKFDRFIQKREGVNPGLQEWEAVNHAAGDWWGGHCNGWAVSAILRQEPTAARWDRKSGVTFKLSSIKGLLAMKDYCANIAMYGERNDGAEPPRADIDPALFHKTLLYYIGELHKPLAFDYRPDEVVDTHIATGYDMTMLQYQPGVLRVGARLKMYKYDQKSSERTGAATEYRRDYVYDLYTNEAGEIVGGAWISDNPDFIYSPLSSAYCPERHPGLTEERLQAVLILPEVR
jgi:hypothetical protein